MSKNKLSAPQSKIVFKTTQNIHKPQSKRREMLYQFKLSEPKIKTTPSLNLDNLSDIAKKIYTLVIQEKEVTMHDLIHRTGMTIEELGIGIRQLEIKNIIESFENPNWKTTNINTSRSWRIKDH